MSRAMKAARWRRRDLRRIGLTWALAVAWVPATAFAEGPPPAADVHATVQALGAGTPRTVSFRDALRLAAQQSPQLAVARGQAAIVDTQVERASNFWKPDLSAGGNYDHTSAPAYVDFGQFASLVGDAYNLGKPDTSKLPPPLTIVAANSWYGNIQLTQPLFTPQGAFLIGPASANAKAAALGADQAREQVLLGVARAYLGLKGIAQLTEAARDAEKVALVREKEARTEMQVGTGIEVALLRAQSESAGARSRLAQLEGQRASLQSLLAALVGEPILPELNAPIEPGLGDPSSEAQAPWEQNYAVLSAKSQLEATGGLVTYDRWAWLPSLLGTARGNYNSNLGFSGVNTSYDLLVSLSFPLYDHGTRYANLHEDEAKQATAQASLDDARAQAQADWIAARANILSEQAVVAETEAQAALTARTQRVVERTVKAGLATNLDLTDADNRLFLAASAAAQSRAVLEIRHAEMAAAEGKLYNFATR